MDGAQRRGEAAPSDTLTTLTTIFSTVYPLDIILGLETEAAISRIDVTVEDFLLPRCIDFKVGQLTSSHSARSLPRLSYPAAKTANYHELGRMEFDSRSKNTADRAREVVSHWFGRGNRKAVGQYLWLVVSEPHPSVENKAQRVHLSRLDVYGSELRERKRRRRRSHKPRGSSRTSHHSSSPESYHYRGRSKTPKGVVTDRFGFRRWRLSSASSGTSSDDSYDYLEAEAIPPYPLTGTSDPLTALHNVRELIQKRRAESVREGSEVEALLCQRNIELIRAYEGEMLEAREKLEAAKRNNDGEHVAHYQAVVKDIRDTCYRNIHLDLLLEKYASLGEK